jgi:hypothetical protein
VNENTLEDQLAQLTNSSVPDGSSENLLRRLDVTTTRIRRRRRLIAFGAGSLMAATTVAVVQAYTSNQNAPFVDAGPDGTAGSTQDLFSLAVEPGEPCPGAVHATQLTELVTDVPVRLPAAKVDDAWTCGSTPVLMFGDVQISYEEGWEGVDVKEKWADMAKQFGGDVQTVLGRPAYVHPADEDGPRNSVNVVVDGVLIRVLAGPKESIQHLVDLANSISPTPVDMPLSPR